MKHYYKDILKKIAEEPAWFDEHGVPRYEPFAIDCIANIYANEVALCEIACQNCGHVFIVAISQDIFEEMEYGHKLHEEIVKDGELAYGDPPNVMCCLSGPTMTSEFKRVVEFWALEHSMWVRKPEYEGDKNE